MDHIETGKRAVAKYIKMIELVTEMSANVAQAAAKNSSAEAKHIGKEVDDLLAGFTSLAVAGTAVIASLAQARIRIDKLETQLATLNPLDKGDSTDEASKVQAMVADALEFVMKKE